MKILGSKFWALGGLNQKSKKPVQFCSFCHAEPTAKNGSIPLRNKKEEAMFLRNRQTADGQDRQTYQRQKIIDS